MDVVYILGFFDEVECMLSVPPYHRVFTLPSSASRSWSRSFMQPLNFTGRMSFFGSEVCYAGWRCQSSEWHSIYGPSRSRWQISIQLQFKISRRTSRCTRCLFPKMVLPSSSSRRRESDLSYCSVMFMASSLTPSRGDRIVKMVIAKDVRILSHIFRGILVDLTYIFARQGRDYASSIQKKSLGLGPFIKSLATYFGIDTSTVWRCSATTILHDHMIL